MQLQWDLTEIYSSNHLLDEDIKQLKLLSDKIVQFKGKLNNKKQLLNFYLISEQFGKVLDKVAGFLFFSKSLDGSNVYALEKIEELESFLYSHNLKTTFVMQELKKIPTKTLKQWVIDKDFIDYSNDIEDIIKSKPHTLTPAIEKVMLGASKAANFSDIFDCLDNVEIKYGYIFDEANQKVKLTNANYRKYSLSNNKRVRKSAYLKVLRSYKAVNQTLASTYISHLKYTNFVAKTYKYKNCLDMQLKSSFLPENLPQKVVKHISANLVLLQSYYDWRKRFMKLEEFESCDLFCNLFDDSVNKTYTLEQALETLKKALLPIGKDYVEMIDIAKEHKWIDSRALPNKDTGAYSSNIYGIHPYILMSFNGTQDSVSTLAHEFGHSMHTYYSEKNQPYTKHDYDIFVAEVASTVNEILLSNYLINNARNSKQKIAYITEFLTTFISTVFTQSEYTEFELFANEAVDKEIPLSYKKLNDFYLKLQKKYCGNNVKVLKDSAYHWSRIPHFYSNFYVFKYVTGFISACAIADKLLSEPEYYKQYRKFLSAGSSKKPCELLKDAGVDILHRDTYTNTFALFEKYLKELQKIKE